MTAKKHVLQSVVLGVFLTALSYILGLSLGWINHVNYLEAFAVFTSYSCTYLCVKERRINYPIGAISTAAYALLFWQQHLVASAVLNLYLTPTLAYGWYRWRKDEVKRPVSRVSWKAVPFYLAVTVVAYFGAVSLSHAFKGTMALTDSAILVGTVLAQLLMDNKKIENWIIWAFVNAFAIYTYQKAGLTIAAFQYVFFFLNTIYGFIEWRRSQNAQSIYSDDSDAAYEGPRALDPILGSAS